MSQLTPPPTYKTGRLFQPSAAELSLTAEGQLENRWWAKLSSEVTGA